MLVCFWMMMTFHHCSSISNIRSVFLHDKTQSPSIKISLFQNRGAAEETFFLFWLMIYLFLVLFLLTLAMIMIYWCHSFLVMLTINASFFVSCIFVDL